MWPWERFAEVGLSLARRTGMKILVLGSGADRDLCARVVRNMGEAGKNLAGETSLMEAAALLEKSSLLVTNDTGLMHLAVAVGTPTVAIFGPTSRELGFMPPGTLARIIETDLPCRPCTTIGRRSCPLGSHDCMLQVTTALVLRESLTQLERRKVAKA
jgi:heptosyltransferase-2